MEIQNYSTPQITETYSTPTDRLNLNDVTVSLTVSVIAGILSALPVGVISLILELSENWMLLAFSTVSPLTFAYFMKIATSLLWEIEETTETDINQDGWIGKPPSAPEPVRIIAQPAPQEIFVSARPNPKTNTIRPFKFSMPPVLLDLLPALSIAILVHGRAFSRPALAQGDDKIMPDSKFRQLSKLFIENGLAIKQNQSTTLTAEGFELLRHYLPDDISEAG